MLTLRVRRHSRVFLCHKLECYVWPHSRFALIDDVVPYFKLERRQARSARGVSIIHQVLPDAVWPTITRSSCEWKAEFLETTHGLVMEARRNLANKPLVSPLAPNPLKLSTFLYKVGSILMLRDRLITLG